MKQITPSRALTGGLAAWTILSLTLLASSDTSHRLEFTLRGPSVEPLSWLGHDAFGRPLTILLLTATGKSLLLALVVVALTSTIALPLGALLAIAPPGFRRSGSAVLEFLLAFPSLIVALTVAAIRGPGWDTLLISLLLGLAPGFVRLIQTRARELIVQPYVDAARSLGAGTIDITFRHLLRGLLPILAVKIPGLTIGVLLSEAALTFLGAGAPIGSDTWGSLLAQGKDYLLEAPHIAVAAGIPLGVTVLLLQQLAERLERPERLNA
jgi:peptide/nickel transport system permease protein